MTLTLPKTIGGKIPQKEHRRLIVEAAVNDTLERLIFYRLEDVPKGTRRDCMFPPDVMGPMWIELDGCDDRLVLDWSAINHPEVVWPVQVGWVFRANNSDWGDHLQCNYFQTTPAKLLRGRYARPSKWNIANYHGMLHGGNEWVSGVTFASWHGGKWLDSGRVRANEAFLDGAWGAENAPSVIGESKVKANELTVEDRVGLGQMLALTYRYEWGAQFSIDGSPRFIVPVTPKGALELFRDRDKPQDRDRRAALRHWVNQHLRKTQGGNFSKVREHLRGNTQFNWRGFDVRIVPSQFDEEKNQK